VHANNRREQKWRSQLADTTPDGFLKASPSGRCVLTSEGASLSVLTSRPQGGVLTSGGVSRSVLVRLYADLEVAFGVHSGVGVAG
jgi:hypothetical protein